MTWLSLLQSRSTVYISFSCLKPSHAYHLTFTLMFCLDKHTCTLSYQKTSPLRSKWTKHRDTSRWRVPASFSKELTQSSATGVLSQLSHLWWGMAPGGMPQAGGSTGGQKTAWGPRASGRWRSLKWLSRKAWITSQAFRSPRAPQVTVLLCRVYLYKDMFCQGKQNIALLQLLQLLS